jgi:hypothetical protein
VELRGIAAQVGAFMDVAGVQHAALEAAVTRQASRRPLADVAADDVAETAALVELLTASNLPQACPHRVQPSFHRTPDRSRCPPLDVCAGGDVPPGSVVRCSSGVSHWERSGVRGPR